jgi:hypothetical protein
VALSPPDRSPLRRNLVLNGVHAELEDEKRERGVRSTRGLGCRVQGLGVREIFPQTFVSRIQKSSDRSWYVSSFVLRV